MDIKSNMEGIRNFALHEVATLNVIDYLHIKDKRYKVCFVTIVLQ